MSFRAFLLVALVCGLSFFSPETAWAKPKHAKFEEVIEKSATIVVSRFLGEQPDKDKRTLSVEITQVLKGDLKPGKHQIAFVDRPHFGSNDEEFIAFLDKDRVWRFMASPLNAETKVAQGVLQLSECYDGGTPCTPGLITLDQLKTYLKDGSLVYQFRGDVYFPEQGKADWKPSSLVISGTYDVINKMVNVKGIPNLQGFPAQPDVFIPSSQNHSALELSYTHLTLNRLLSLIGEVRGFDNKSGEMTCRFAVSSPVVLTQKAFEDYLADANKSACYYKFKLTCVPTKDNTIPKVVFLMMESDAKPWLIGIGKAPLYPFEISYHSATWNYSSTTIGNLDSRDMPKTIGDERRFGEHHGFRMTVKTEAGDWLTVRFQIGEPTNKDDDAFSSENYLLYPLYRNQVKGTITLHDGETARQVATFTTALDSVGFNRKDKR